MNLFTISAPVKGKEDYNGGYVSIHDNGFACQRELFITDDEGNTVKLKNEQIGELFNHIKPSLMG